jgi:class 3 adenylate cyclase
VEAERRQVTVLFADMVGFTSFSERCMSKLMADDAVYC